MSKAKIEEAELKQECVERLKILGLDSNIINDFEKDEKVYITSIGGEILEATKYDYVYNLMKSFEENWKVKIYHIVSIERKMRDTVHILYVSKAKSKWKTEKEDLKNGNAQTHTLETVRAFMQNNINIETQKGKITKIDVR